MLLNLYIAIVEMQILNKSLAAYLSWAISAQLLHEMDS